MHLRKVEGRGRQRGRGFGWFACAWLCLERLGLVRGCLASAPGGAELFGTRLIITRELQKHLSLFTKVDSHFSCACALKDLLAVVEVLIGVCKQG